MKEKLTLQELRVLAKLLKAEYIDFDYLTMMNSADGESEVLASEAKNSLFAKGWIDEDFSGNAEVVPEICALVSPVFGEREAAFFEDTVDGENVSRTATIRLHMAKGAATLAIQNGDELELITADDTMLTDTIAALVEKVESEDASIPVQETQNYKPEKLYTVKYYELGKKSEVDLYIQASGKLLYDDNSGTVRELSKKTFADEAVRIMKGELLAK